MWGKGVGTCAPCLIQTGKMEFFLLCLMACPSSESLCPSCLGAGRGFLKLRFASVVTKIWRNFHCENRLGKEPAGLWLGSQGPWKMAGATRCLGRVHDGRSPTLRQLSPGGSCHDNDRSACDWPTLICLQDTKEPARHVQPQWLSGVGTSDIPRLAASPSASWI